MPRIIIDPRNVRDGAIAVTDLPTLHHLLDVLRVTEGQRVECVDGAGRWYATRVAHQSRRELRLAILDQGEEPSPGLAIRLVQALIKPDRFDWLLQKATELGVARVSPVMTARSIIRVRGDRAPGRVARWQRIATEAAQQCGRATIPAIDAPVPFGEVVPSLSGQTVRGSRLEAQQEGEGSRVKGEGKDLLPSLHPSPFTLDRSSLEPSAPSLILLPTLAVSGCSLRETLRDVGSVRSAAVLIGPEGDFAQEEVVLAQRHGAVPVSLGPRTLRSETAAVAMLAILQHAAGEL